MKKLILLCCLFLAALSAAGSAGAETWYTTNNLLAHAVPNECYAGLGGVDYPLPTNIQGAGRFAPGDGFTTPVICPETATVQVPDPAHPGSFIQETRLVYEKTNDTYVWALTEEGTSLWFASAANVMCTTGGAFLGEMSYGEYSLNAYRNLPVYVNHSRDITGKPMYAFTPRAAPAPVCNGACGALVCTDIYGTAGNCNDSSGAYMQNNYRLYVPYNVCEHGDSMFARTAATPGARDAIGDWRPSKVFRYDKTTGKIENLTTKIYNAGHLSVFNNILGIRAAGSLNGVVFFAGGNLSDQGVTFFAFNASTGDYLGYHTYTTYRQLRQMIVVNNQLYTGVAGASSSSTGYVLHWTGSLSNPFSWETVGRISGSVTALSGYVANGQTRIVANAAGGLYVSPAMRSGVLSPSQAYGWRRIWNASVYEPDPYTLSTYAPGAVAQLGEWIYWGTMHVPYQAYYNNAQTRYGGIDKIPQVVTGKTPSGSDRTLQNDLYNGTFRATSVWRARNLQNTRPEIQLVYGETYLGAYNSTTQTWFPVPTGWTPLNPSTTNSTYFGTLDKPIPVGSSGFYNQNNNYSWTALTADFGDGTGPHLFWGTMDQTMINSANIYQLAPSFDVPATEGRGADLWRFSLGADGNGWGGATATTAQPEFINGGGNVFHYGIRCLKLSDDGKRLYLGMAGNGSLINPNVFNVGWMNGGWGLRELSRQP